MVDVQNASALTDFESFVAGEWYIDPTHTSLTFSIRHGLAKVRCAFHDVAGRIVTRDDVESSEVYAVIDPASFSTGFEFRDAKIRSLPAFLWSEMYPTIEYRSRRVVVDGTSATIEGDLTLLGKTHPVDLTVVDGAFGHMDEYGTRIGVAAVAQFDKRDFGMINLTQQFRASTDLGDENRLLGWTIDVEIEIEAVLASDPGRYGLGRIRTDFPSASTDDYVDHIG